MKITRSTPKEEILKVSMDCRQCGNCCRYGVGFAKEEELEKISEKLGMPKDKLVKKYFEKIVAFNKEIYKPKQKRLPYGPCIFLEKNICKIHDVKPLHCRIGNCNEHGEDLTEWHFVNSLVDFEDPQSIREWQTRIELKETIDGGTPEEIVEKEQLDKILRYEILTKEDLTKEKQNNKKENL